MCHEKLSGKERESTRRCPTDGVGQGGWDGQGVEYLMTHVMFSVFGLRLHSFLSRQFFPADFFQVSFCPVCFFKAFQFSGPTFKLKRRKTHTREYLQNRPKVLKTKNQGLATKLTKVMVFVLNE